MEAAVSAGLAEGTSRAARATADRLIAASRTKSAEYPTELANHLPMLLEIYARLGASPVLLEDYAASYSAERGIPPAPAAVVALGESDWRTALGARERETDLRDFFTAEVGRLGWRIAVRRYVPVLAPGVGGSALHPLMRLAFGVLREDEAEIGAALGFWAAAYMPLRDSPAGTGDIVDPLDLLAVMRAEPAFATVRAGPDDLLWHWMRAVGAMDAFAPLIDRLVINGDTLDRVAEAGLALFAAAPKSLEAVHAMTGAWWVRVVAPHIDAPERLARFFWQAVMALYPKTGMPMPDERSLAALRAVEPPSPAALVTAVLAAGPLADDGEHHPSVVFTAIVEHARTGDPLFLVAAGKRMNLVG